MGKIYLDNAATTKVKQEVIDAMLPYFYNTWHNPSSLYSAGAKVKEDIESARKTVADFIGAGANEIYFTSGGSESNCWAIQGFANYYDSPVVITSLIEHKSIMECVIHAKGMSGYVWVDKDGFIDIEQLEEKISFFKTHGMNILVSIQFANNEIGTIQKIKEISNTVHKHQCVLHVDAVQAFGQVPIDVNDLGIDMMSVSGHKIYAPKGIGFLYKRNGVDIKPLIYGSQMDGMRGGTENVPYIIGMAKAVELVKENMKNQSRIALTRDYFIEELENIGCQLVGSREHRLPNNISIMLPDGISGESMLYMLDMCGIYVSTGSACNSRSVEPSHVLKSIGLSNDESERVIRITFSSDITKDEIDKVVREIARQIQLSKMLKDY